jgi:hypothetical protein
VLFELGISRAFDSISWSFLFEVLSHLGFPVIFLCWLAVLLCNASTRVSVNGVPGKRIFHVSGLGKGTRSTRSCL